MPFNNQFNSQYNSQYNPTFTNLDVNNTKNTGIFNKMLRILSSDGMDYDKMILRNSIGVNYNENPIMSGNLYDLYQQKSLSSILDKKSVAYLDKSYADKQRILRAYSIKDEIRDYVTTVADECIEYNDDKDFCSIKALPSDYSADIQNKYQEFFEKIYNNFHFNDSLTAWQMMKDFLIVGYIALEIVYDDKKKNIIGFNRLKAETLVPAFEYNIGRLWIQYPEDPQLRRIFLDSQIIYISYTTQKDFSETSYVEGLIRPYNQLKLLEETRIMYNIITASVYQKYTVPLHGLSPQKAKEQMGQLISEYYEEVTFDDSLGTVQINGQKHLPYNKQLWFPETETGKPDMELISPQGHDLNESDILKWFRNILQRASKIPQQRFNEDNGGGNIINEAAEITNDELNFHKFINRLRANFKEIVVKPLRLQMLIEFPELKDDERFINSVDIIFNTNQLFEEWKKLTNLQKRADILNTLITIQNADGNPYYHIDYLMDEVMKMSPEEKAKNAKYWNTCNGAATADSGAESGGGSVDSESSDMVGGEETPPSDEENGESNGG